MLVAEPARTSTHRQHHRHCLDLLKVIFELASPAAPEEAVLMEIWDAGGLMQIDHDVPPGALFRLACGNRSVPGRVISSEKDDYGHLVVFAVDRTQEWFPQTYQPPYLLPEQP